MAHFHDAIHTRRIELFLGRIKRHILAERLPVTAEFAQSADPVPFGERLSLDYGPASEGQCWGKTWDSAWFRLHTTVPSAWAGQYVVVQVDLGGECLVFDTGGNPMLGLTNGSVFDADFNKDIIHLLPSCQGGEEVDLWIEAAANGLFGVHRPDPEHNSDPARLHGHYEARVNALRLCRFDYELWQLWLDMEILRNLMGALPENSVRRARLLRGINRAIDVYPRDGVEACRNVLRPLCDVPSNPASLDVYGVGHAHIDTGWLWPVRETIRKCARTFSSQIGLIERYPDYVFGASQAQHYQMVKDHYPSLYERIRRAVADGRWEVQGGMWVEADCNVTGGESLVRQLVHGKNFFRDEFGVEVRNLWLPDVFGYSANLPQILKKAGIDYFLTQKLSWSRYNTFPHNTFIWRGIDGSEVLAHFPPEDNYNSPVLPSQILRDEQNNKEKAIVDEAICLFGIGDGGGGPKEEHIERGLRLADLNGCPRFHFGPAQLVLEKMASYGDELDTWVGELYLEVHRGTLTTQAMAKKLNRRLEEALRTTEMLCAAAGLDTYPIEELDKTWKTLLINQFHDILPGSSIHMVYENTEKEHRACLDTCRRLAQEAVARLGRPEAGRMALFNPSSTDFADVVELPPDWPSAAAVDGARVDVQEEAGRRIALVRVPARHFLELEADSAVAQTAHSTALSEPVVIENDLVRYELDGNLRLVAGWDKEAQRPIVPSNDMGNVLSLYEDRPHFCDAWDVDEYYENELLETAVAESAECSRGPVRQGVRGTLRVGESTIRQEIWLREGSKRLDFVTEVDWRETHKMLRVSFPTTVSAESATFEIQYGLLRRPTHRNTYWDWARFEAVGHRFADLSEPDFGVALLNDCKYGYKVHDNVLDLNLLRSPTEPDPVADRGRHRLTYSLLPHCNDLPRSSVLAEAAMLNQGVSAFADIALQEASLPVTLTGDGIELAVLKRAEKENCLVVRVVETRGIRTSGTLTARDSAARITPTDLVEWDDEEGSSATGTIRFDLAPFELKTLKVCG